MSTLQKRSTTALETRLLILVRNLEHQLYELNKLRYQVRQAERSARKSRRTDNGIRERAGKGPRPRQGSRSRCSVRTEPAPRGQRSRAAAVPGSRDKHLFSCIVRIDPKALIPTSQVSQPGGPASRRAAQSSELDSLQPKRAADPREACLFDP
jgi:hypothetical protein